MRSLVTSSLALLLIVALAGPSLAAGCEVYGLSLKVGEKTTVPGKCSLIECNGRGSDEFVIKACPNAYAPKNCKFVPVDLNKTYPDCCPHWTC